MQKKGESAWPPLVGRPAFWIGAAIPLTVICWNILSYFMPDFPKIPITRAGDGVAFLHVSRYIPDRYFYIGIQFFIAGFAYWTSLDVLFSIWFFYLLIVGEVYTFNRIGYTIGTPGLWSSTHAANAWQAFGALACMLCWGLWMAREHLKGVWHAIRGRKTLDDSEELMSYRTAGIGGLAGLLFIIGWLHAAGMALYVIAPFLIGMGILYIGIARVIAESGLVYLRGSMMPPTFALYTLGSANIPAASMANFAFSFAYFTDAKSLAMASMAHCSWITAAIKGRKRMVAIALALAGITAAISSVVFTLYLGYETGAYNFRAFEFRTHPRIFDYWVRQMQTHNPPDWKRNRILWLWRSGDGTADLVALPPIVVAPAPGRLCHHGNPSRARNDLHDLSRVVVQIADLAESAASPCTAKANPCFWGYWSDLFWAWQSRQS